MADYKLERDKWPKPEMYPTRWQVLDEFVPVYGRVFGPIYIETTGQRDGSTKYAIRSRSMALGKSGNWSYEPMPSSRSDHYLKTHRWNSLQEAEQAAIKASNAMIKQAENVVAEKEQSDAK